MSVSTASQKENEHIRHLTQLIRLPHSDFASELLSYRNGCERKILPGVTANCVGSSLCIHRIYCLMRFDLPSPQIDGLGITVEPVRLEGPEVTEQQQKYTTYITDADADSANGWLRAVDYVAHYMGTVRDNVEFQPKPSLASFSKYPCTLRRVFSDFRECSHEDAIFFLYLTTRPESHLITGRFGKQPFLYDSWLGVVRPQGRIGIVELIALHVLTIHSSAEHANYIVIKNSRVSVMKDRHVSA